VSQDRSFAISGLWVNLCANYFALVFLVYSMFDLANVVPTLARYYQQASEAYEQACTRYINSIINYVRSNLQLLKKNYRLKLSVVSNLEYCMMLPFVAYVNVLYEQQFERLFQFAQKVENLLYTISPEEMPFQLGYSKMDLRKTLKASLSGVRSLTSSFKFTFGIYNFVHHFLLRVLYTSDIILLQMSQLTLL